MENKRVKLRNVANISTWRKDFRIDAEKKNYIFDVISHKGNILRLKTEVNPSGYWITTDSYFEPYEPYKINLPEDLFVL